MKTPWLKGRAGKSARIRKPKRRAPRPGSHRLMLIELLRAHPRDTGELKRITGFSPNTILGSLLILERKRIVARIQAKPGRPAIWFLAKAIRTAFTPTASAERILQTARRA